MHQASRSNIFAKPQIEIALELLSMDRAMEENDRVIRRFCEELGIDVPL